MSRKEFIQSQGATCRNWTWSWSFINKEKKLIIFGAWDTHIEGQRTRIFDEQWEYNYAGRKNPAYQESLEHIRLIENSGYTLMTFPMIYSGELKDENDLGPAKIKSFVPKLTKKSLQKVGSTWYASDDILTNQIPEEVLYPEKYTEGTSRTVSINAYERNPKARAACIRHYGSTCIVCGFNFQNFYGEIGKGIIHVHHLIPLSEIKGTYDLDPIKELVPVCPNCHAIIHSTQPPLTIEQPKEHLGRAENVW